MRVRPEDIDDADVVDAVGDGWGLVVRAIEFAPVGFGGHHWWVAADDGDWFVTVNDLVGRRRHRAETLDVPRRRLEVAMSVARSLRDDGLDFVVAPRRTRSGTVLHPVGERLAMTVHPLVVGDTREWGPYPTREERVAVIDRLAVLHAATTEPAPLVDDLTVPDRDRLVEALGDLAGPWDAGPFGEPARRLLDEHAGAVVEAFGHYDELAATVARRPERFVITHGEPHRGNTIDTVDGIVLVDWDTVRTAPPERDLWALADEDPSILDAYEERTGTAPDGDALETFRMWWDLIEVATYVGRFREPHVDDEDTQVAWNGLTVYLDPGRWART